jgi:hypothetical protein
LEIEIVLILPHYTRDSVRDSVRYINNLQTNYVGRTAMQFSFSAVSKVCVVRADSTGSSNSHIFALNSVPLTALGFLLFLPLLVRHLRTCHEKKKRSFCLPPFAGPCSTVTEFNVLVNCLNGA